MKLFPFEYFSNSLCEKSIRETGAKAHSMQKSVLQAIKVIQSKYNKEFVIVPRNIRRYDDLASSMDKISMREKTHKNTNFKVAYSMVNISCI